MQNIGTDQLRSNQCYLVFVIYTLNTTELVILLIHWQFIRFAEEIYATINPCADTIIRISCGVILTPFTHHDYIVKLELTRTYILLLNKDCRHSKSMS